MDKDNARKKALLFSVTKKDFEIQTFRAGGKGGQNQNKVNSGVRLIHKASGARAEARDSRDQKVNKRNAFLRLLETPEWKAWHRAEVCRRSGIADEAERAVEMAMNPANLKIEVMTTEGWQVAAGDGASGGRGRGALLAEVRSEDQDRQESNR